MKKWIMPAFGVLLALAVTAQGAVVVQDTWPSDQGWGISGNADETGDTYDATSDGSADYFGGNLGGRTGTFRVQAEQGGAGYYDVISDLGNLADEAGNNFVTADIANMNTMFYSNPGGIHDTPASLRLYFLHNEGGDDVIWYCSVDMSSWTSSGWYDIAQSLTFGDGGVGFGSWYTETAGQNTSAGFADALTDVDEVGVFIGYQNQAGQVYGLDDFKLLDSAIPEPGTYSMLGFAMLSLAMTFRRKLNAVWAGLRKS